MSVIVPAFDRNAPYPKTGTASSAVLRALDEHLFNPSATAWLAIDERNQAVRGVAVSSLETGLALVGQGRVAALVGRLREGVGVIDVDVAGDFGTWISSELSDWLARQGCWVLTRPSGGAPGRAHVFFAHPTYRHARAGERTGLAAVVSDHIDALRAEIKVSARDVDLRDTVRPLSSPHRRGHHTVPDRSPSRALRTLQALFPDRPQARALPKRPRVRSAGADEVLAGRAVVALEFEQWRRPLRAGWRTYLLGGVAPIATSDRSLVEAACTSELVWAIGDPEAAWRVVREAHPAAMSKARSHGRSWWTRYVWNAAVEEAQAFSAALPETRSDLASPSRPDGAVVAAVVSGREVLSRLQWTVPVRQRPSVLLVGHALLDRVARTGLLRVPCPERDLVLDTAIADRKTIRAALRLLDGSLGTLHRDAFDEEDRAGSSFEFEISGGASSGVREIPPPEFHPPLPPATVWASLPRASHSLWRTLWAQAAPSDLPTLATLSGLTATLGEVGTPSQLATARAALRALAAAGLAQVGADGTWTPLAAALPPELERVTSQRRVELHSQIEVERALYRCGSSSRWHEQRAQVLRTVVSRRHQWWHSLGDAERRARALRKRAEFHALPAQEQNARKEMWRRRRQLIGVVHVSRDVRGAHPAVPRVGTGFHSPAPPGSMSGGAVAAPRARASVPESLLAAP